MPSASPPRIGRYAIERRLAQGGMGTVFLARDPAIDRLVAIKLMRHGFEDPRLRDRFTREAQSIGRMHHQNIVTVFDVGEHEGEPFIAMEYVEGRTLANVIARKETSLARTLQITDELCAGLHYAHQTGIVHRDIKPANIMVDSAGTVKILDFGIARGPAAGLTQTGMILGTLNYMSPEQLQNRSIDHRTDIFAVGAVLYELLSGRQAFPGDTLARIITLIVTEGPEPLLHLCPELDPGVIAMVDRCLQRDVDLRYSDLGLLRQDVAVMRRALDESRGLKGVSRAVSQPAADGGLSQHPRRNPASDAPTLPALDRDVQPATAGSLRGKQIFVSYAQTPVDTRFANYVADRLRAAGVGVWLDESPLPAPHVRKSAMEKAVAQSAHAVFIVSPSWLQREWTALELDLFSKRDGVRRIPILRARRAQLTLPPQLLRQPAVEWPDDDPDYNARFWELLCAISGADPGPREGWSRHGRSVSPIAPPPVPLPPRLTVRPSLRCDRTPQWTSVDNLATDGFNDLILIPGVAGQDHDHFVQRIQCLLRMDPPRSMTKVDWPARPSNRGECFELLAQALRVPVASIATEIAERLLHENLILLHPCIRARFVDQTLVRYYTEWLPELVSGRRPSMHLKCVQPIEWPPESRTLEQLLTWMRLRPASDRDGKLQAEELIRLVRGGADPALRVVRLHDLEDITDEDLVRFCELVDLNGKQQEWFLSRIRMRKPARAKDVFQAIDDYLPDARSIT
jgi:serine/threonine protein kinase